MIKNRISVKVLPRSSKTELVGMLDDGTLKIRIKAPPEDGKANAELCYYLSELYGGNWEVVSGAAHTRKIVKKCS